MKVIAVDHGEKRIGLAISDPTGTIARPLWIIHHSSRVKDAALVAELARENQAGLIVIGQSFDEEGCPNPAGRRAVRFAAELRNQTEIPVLLWDESLTTQDARQERIEWNIPLKKRRSHVDDLAAAVLLQSYLDAQHAP